MMKLDPRIEEVRVRYGLDPTDFWELPQKKGTWVAKHSALEVVAVKAGIEFDNPITIEANTEAGIAVVSVRGMISNSDGTVRGEWSIGEASPKNNRNAYPWAMAEKRAKDRVILKLSGIHGLVYSDNEMDGADGPTAAPAVMPQISSFRAKQLLRTDVLLSEIDNAKDERRCDELATLFGTELAFLPTSWLDRFRERLTERREEIANGSGTRAEEANATLDRQFRETVG